MVEPEAKENNRSFLAVFIAISSGCLFAVAAALGKVATEIESAYTLLIEGQLIAVIASIPFWMMIFSAIGGSILWIWALKKGRVSIVGPVQIGFMILFSVVLGVIVFGESMTLPKVLGIITVSLGGILLSRKS